MDINPIKTEADYEATLREIEGLMDAELDTPAGDRLDILATLVERYEDRRHRIEPIEDPIEFLLAYFEMSGRSRADLAELFGSRPRASEILNRRRPLTVEMIRKLSSEWHLPADVLVKPYRVFA
jgi:HTH-type transcriptional regulator/antitoxin HigA